MDLRNTARLQLGGQCRAAAFEILFAALADADEQQALRLLAVDRRGFGDRARRAIEARLRSGPAEQRPERPGLALADRKCDDVGTRTDLRVQLNVHALTFL